MDAFKDLKIMVELDLSYNNLTNLEPGTFHGNERLQTLTLAHNDLAALHPFQFPPLKYLKTIDLSHNLLTTIDRKTFSRLGRSVESILINNNELRTLREDVFNPLSNLKSLQLHLNPWLCDCRLKTFRDWVVDSGLYTYPTACVEPERLSEKLWSDVDQKDFACKPEIHVPQSVVFSQPGANVTLSCFIIGSPMPEAKWVLKVSMAINQLNEGERQKEWGGVGLNRSSPPLLRQIFQIHWQAKVSGVWPKRDGQPHVVSGDANSFPIC